MTALRLPADLGSPRAARRWLADGFVGQDVADEVRFSAELLTSELVTNAVIHARTPVTVVLVVTAVTVRVEVSDHDPRVPQARGTHDAAVNGRGLRIVEQVAGQWGVTGHDGGKTVWFELTR